METTTTDLQILIIGTVWPEPDSSAAGTRMIDLVRLFIAQGWSVTFGTSAQKSEFSFDLESLGVKEVPVELNHSSFNGLVAELNPDVVVFDRFMTEEQFGWRVRQECPNALLILDSEDLHFLRIARQEVVKAGGEFTEVDLRSDHAVREVASIYRCDLTLIISSYEMKLLKEQFNMDSNLLHYLPFGVDAISEETKAELPTFEARQHFMTIGNFLHPPNWDAVQFLKNEIWPNIRKELPEVEMHVYGAYASEKHRLLNDPKSGFYVKGRTEDPKEEFQSHRVMLAPIRFGAGLKGKLFEAMQCGTPSVTTAIGAEGMSGGLPWGGKIQDDVVQFSKSAVRLYQNKSEWMAAQKSAFSIVREVFTDPEHGIKLIEKVRSLHSNLKAHRSQNFIGKMLHHHTMRSTEFMSRWIEEKNR